MLSDDAAGYLKTVGSSAAPAEAAQCGTFVANVLWAAFRVCRRQGLPEKYCLGGANIVN
ncbi:hypothetical protein EIKCOROL_01395 [Eikenella corrodens ATCC 23834]|uniref:Uncharacterized protein n=1 Tax=Eikenella corrodens ATCC 23834 TaxID=546274 RepID=C0DVK6_EIKCO|nr:hypothetical protein EIKCOROL_01395 [Eikenella corrodens ATCC 23834]